MEVVQKQEMGLIFFWRKVHGNAVSSRPPIRCELGGLYCLFLGCHMCIPKLQTT